MAPRILRCTNKDRSGSGGVSNSKESTDAYYSSHDLVHRINYQVGQENKTDSRACYLDKDENSPNPGKTSVAVVTGAISAHITGIQPLNPLKMAPPGCCRRQG